MQSVTAVTYGGDSDEDRCTDDFPAACGDRTDQRPATCRTQRDPAERRTGASCGIAQPRVDAGRHRHAPCGVDACIAHRRARQGGSTAQSPTDGELPRSNEPNVASDACGWTSESGSPAQSASDVVPLSALRIADTNSVSGVPILSLRPRTRPEGSSNTSTVEWLKFPSSSCR